MKYILPLAALLLAGFMATAQNTDTVFQKQWRVIDSLIIKSSLPKTALAKVNALYAEAKQKKQEAQVIKALLYKLSLQGQVTEQDINATIAAFEAETAATNNPLQQSILLVQKAASLQNYYNNNRWRLRQRSDTSNYKKADITTWSAADFYTAIATLYTKALQPAAQLQQTGTNQYAAIVVKGNTQQLRPTLYDLLANRALDFYKDAGSYNSEAQQDFTIADTAALAPVEVFVKHKFVADDTASRLLNALLLYQQLLQFHLGNNDTAALIDANLARLTWVYQNAAIHNKDALYKTALQGIAGQYGNLPAAAEAWYRLLNMEAERGRGYNPFDDTANRYAFVAVHQKIKERLAAQPAASEGNSHLQQLLNEIEKTTLHTEAESVNLPGQPFRLLVQYKNVDTFYSRIISKKLVDALRQKKEDGFWKKVSALPYLRASVQPLPVTGDYQQHRVEVKIDALPAGEYVLLGSSTAGFSDTAGWLLTQPFTVSHLSYIKKGNDYFVLDRETGKPLKGVTVNITVKENGYSDNEYKGNKLPPIITGKDGYFNVPASVKKGNYGYVAITLTDGNDVLEDNRGEYYYIGYDNKGSSALTNLTNAAVEKQQATMQLFTDRAIYRPGQKLFFKGIATTTDAATHEPKLYITGDSLRVYLRNVNEQNIDSLNITLNAYGSAAGSFVLPQQALTGSFSLTVKGISGQQFFRVEEYKRPTYYVQLDTLKAAYRLNDTVTVTGFAQAFAGNFINGAQVKYSVRRVSRPVWGWYGKRGGSSGNERQIAQGQMVTDGSGKFTIKFPALPDAMMDTAAHPVFDFAVSATVTDAGGETREANTTVSAGYVSLTLKLEVPAEVNNAAFKTIPVAVQNLAGKPVDAAVQLHIYPLVSPGRVVHARYWDRPDVFVMGRQEFIQQFPYDEYEAENDVHTWQKAAAVVTDTFNASALRGAFTLKRAALPPGWYVVEATTTDKDGHTVKDIAYTEVYDAAAATVPALDENFNTSTSTPLHPGDKATLLTGSAFNEVYVIQQVDKPSRKTALATGVQQYTVYTLNGNGKQTEVPVTEEDRGGFGVYYTFVKHNRFYTGEARYQVPFDNKELHLQYTSFRNKTEPGSKEQWVVKIQGADSGRAELLTAMYDASLDQFVQHEWDAPDVWRNYNGANNWQHSIGFKNDGSYEYSPDINDIVFDKSYDALATSGEEFLSDGFVAKSSFAAVPGLGGNISLKANGDFNRFKTNSFYKEGEMLVHAELVSKNNGGDGASDDIDKTGNESSPSPQLRTNFNETAFFFPQVYADTAGNYNIAFTMPESLTKWKWLSLAHTKALSFGVGMQSIITQKTLMVQPGMPRFLREGDKLELTARISNLGDTALTGQAALELLDAATGNPVDGLFQNVFPNQYFTAEAGQTTVLKFPVVVPVNFYHPLTYRIVAKTNGFSDGEQNTLPILTNRILVTESLPLYVKGDTTKHFTFSKLLNNTSESLQTQSLTVEYTANPVWTALQSLPYLMEYPYECAEQTFNRFYANALAAYIVNKHPRIKEVFKQWEADSTALLSNLDKNQSLKQVLLAETPWVLDAQNQAQQKKNIALLFNMVGMAANTKNALQKLQDMQLDNGGFAWFKGDRANRYITQYIVRGIGRLQQLHAVPDAQLAAIKNIAAKGLAFVDDEAAKDYNQLVKSGAKLTGDNLNPTAIQYLYMRSYFGSTPLKNSKAYNYWYKQVKQYWPQQTVYMKGMAALVLLRSGQQAFVAKKIYPSITENAVEDEEKGMYWKDSRWGYYWYQSPMEQQALLIELAESMATANTPGAQKQADDMKTWLINQKQTTNWKTTKATADACYALLLNNSATLDASRTVTIQLGTHTINSSSQSAEAGTGYFKQVIDGKEAEPAMGNITVGVHTAGGVKNASPSWGAVYWQYLEDMDKIIGAATPLVLHKQLFTEHTTAAGKVLTPVTDDSVLHVGDKVIVRIELKSERDMEYLHLKDMRAASMEPVNVLSGYQWQDGLGYYQSTKDAATDFFISYLSKGSYVFEYPVYITHTGTFSAGIATIQCMYAPEFTSHSEGLKVVVE